ncbi:MAG: hypothetical protein AAF414_11665 [Pseudomonadota bacterium]
MDIAYHDLDITVVEGPRLSDETMSEIAHLRKTVWQAIAPEGARRTDNQWIDPIDATALHSYITIEDGIVAAGRVSIHRTMDDFTESSILKALPDWDPPLPLGMMGHLVVDPAYRLHGYATVLDLVRIEAARQEGAHATAGLMVPWRVNSMKGLGYREIGPVPGDEHGYLARDCFLMQKTLSAHVSDGYFGPQ